VKYAVLALQVQGPLAESLNCRVCLEPHPLFEGDLAKTLQAPIKLWTVRFEDAQTGRPGATHSCLKSISFSHDFKSLSLLFDRQSYEVTDLPSDAIS
jgi:hypothetical protein